MREVTPEPDLAALLSKYQGYGGALEYVFLEPSAEAPPEQLHRAAAVAGMSAIDRRLARWAASLASKESPVEKFFHVRWDEAKLTGARVPFRTFWGADEIESKPIGDHARAIPNVDGYKTASFHPPHGLCGSPDEKAALFAGINQFVVGEDWERAEVFSWSTEWSNYFDAGHEWWGAFFWTIRPFGLRRLVVVAASSTD